MTEKYNFSLPDNISFHMLNNSYLKGCLHTIVNHGISTVNWQKMFKCLPPYVPQPSLDLSAKSYSWFIETFLCQGWITSAWNVKFNRFLTERHSFLIKNLYHILEDIHEHNIWKKHRKNLMPRYMVLSLLVWDDCNWSLVMVVAGPCVDEVELELLHGIIGVYSPPLKF